MCTFFAFVQNNVVVNVLVPGLSLVASCSGQSERSSGLRAKISGKKIRKGTRSRRLLRRLCMRVFQVKFWKGGTHSRMWNVCFNISRTSKRKRRYFDIRENPKYRGSSSTSIWALRRYFSASKVPEVPASGLSVDENLWQCCCIQILSRCKILPLLG